MLQDRARRVFLLVHRFGDRLRRRHDRRHLLGGLRKGLRGLLRLVLGDAHPVRNLLGGALGLGGEFLHFRCDDHEPAAGASRARRLDRRVQREKIGLRGNRVDHSDQRADLLRGSGEVGDGRLRLVQRSERGGHAIAAVRGPIADLVTCRHEA